MAPGRVFGRQGRRFRGLGFRVSEFRHQGFGVQVFKPRIQPGCVLAYRVSRAAVLTG